MIKSIRLKTPPLSSGLGRGPLKAKTRVRVPLGALSFNIHESSKSSSPVAPKGRQKARGALSFNTHESSKSSSPVAPKGGQKARGALSLLIFHQVLNDPNLSLWF